MHVYVYTGSHPESSEGSPEGASPRGAFEFEARASQGIPGRMEPNVIVVVVIDRSNGYGNHNGQTRADAVEHGIQNPNV